MDYYKRRIYGWFMIKMEIGRSYRDVIEIIENIFLESIGIADTYYIGNEYEEIFTATLLYDGVFTDNAVIKTITKINRLLPDIELSIIVYEEYDPNETKRYRLKEGVVSYYTVNVEYVHQQDTEL